MAAARGLPICLTGGGNEESRSTRLSSQSAQVETKPTRFCLVSCTKRCLGLSSSCTPVLLAKAAKYNQAPKPIEILHHMGLATATGLTSTITSASHEIQTFQFEDCFWRRNCASTRHSVHCFTSQCCKRLTQHPKSEHVTYLRQNIQYIAGHDHLTNHSPLRMGICGHVHVAGYAMQMVLIRTLPR